MRTRLRLFGLLLAASPALWATTLCPTTTTLDTYIGLNATGGCQIGNAIFSNFSYSYTRGLGLPDMVDPDVTASGVQVMLSGSSTDPTLSFQANWTASAGFQTLLAIGYSVEALNSVGGTSPPPAWPIEGSTVNFTGTVNDLAGLPSNITSSLNLSPTGGPVIVLTPSLYPSTCTSPTAGCTESTQGSAGLNSVQTLTVGDQFLIDSGGSGGSSSNTATLTQFQQTIAEAPEPSTLLAAGLGLLLCGWFVARRARLSRPNPGVSGN